MSNLHNQENKEPWDLYIVDSPQILTRGRSVQSGKEKKVITIFMSHINNVVDNQTLQAFSNKTCLNVEESFL